MSRGSSGRSLEATASGLRPIGPRPGAARARATASVEADAGRARRDAVDLGVVVGAAATGRGDDGVEAAVAALEDAGVAVRPVWRAVGDGGIVVGIAGGTVEVDAATHRRRVA